MEAFEQTSNNSVSHAGTPPLTDIFSALAVPRLEGVNGALVADSLALSELTMPPSLRDIANDFLKGEFENLSFSPHALLKYVRNERPSTLAA